MLVGTSNLTKNMDNACVTELEIPLIVMMENAVNAAMKNMDIDKNNSYTVVCGVGNNGGDGLGIARKLYILGKRVDVFLVGKKEKLTDCSSINFKILENMGVNLTFINDENINVLEESLKNTDVCVDAIFGTGLKRDVTGIFAEVIESMNKFSKKIYSIDISSGLDSDTGDIKGIAAKACKTISFEFYKRGFLNYKADDYTGEIVVEDIGVPKSIKDKFHNSEFIIGKNEIKRFIKKKDKNAHKGNFGRVSIVAGSRGFYGAAKIATESAVKTGSGLVTLISDSDVQEKLCTVFTEAMTVNYSEEERVKKLIENSNAIGIGPGMGDNKTTLKIVADILKVAKCPVIIDADGINCLKNDKDILKNSKVDKLITPHPAELSRITGFSMEYINNNRIDAAKEAARNLKSIVLLKGNRTVITDGYTTYINMTGNSAMANGGMGDCLTGIITSLAGQRMNLFEAAVVGAYLHGYIGDKIAEEKYTVNATDIIEKIPYIMKEFEIL